MVVLDSGGAGFGASGRNGGQVLPGLKWDPDELVARFGAERGERIAAFAGNAPQLVYRLVEAHGIDCGLRRNCGWLNAAVDEAAFARQAARAEQWARRGAPVRVSDRQETADLLGTSRYRGALVDDRAGALNPLAYASEASPASQSVVASAPTTAPAAPMTAPHGPNIEINWVPCWMNGRRTPCPLATCTAKSPSWKPACWTAVPISRKEPAPRVMRLFNCAARDSTDRADRANTDAARIMEASKRLVFPSMRTWSRARSSAIMV